MLVSSGMCLPIPFDGLPSFKTGVGMSVASGVLDVHRWIGASGAGCSSLFRFVDSDKLFLLQ